MEFEKILAISGPIIGIIIGWGLTQWSNITKVKRENKGNLKLVLFNLLEVHHLMFTSDEQMLSKTISEKLISKFVPKQLQPHIPREMINHIYGEFFKNKLFPHLHTKLPKILKDYEDSIETIKRVEPILAFRLSGKTEIIDYLNNLGNILGIAEMQESEKQINEKLLSSLTPELRLEMLKDFEDDILDVARQIGISTWFRTRKRLKRKKSQKENNERIEKLISSMKPKLEEMNLSQLELGSLTTGLDLNSLKEQIEKSIKNEKENYSEQNVKRQ